MTQVNALTVIINDQILLNNISCSLEPGRITGLIGKSGAGKTTLLKAFAGLITPHKGDVIINGKNIATLTANNRAQEIGYVFQNFNLFPHLTALENCIDPLIVHGFSYSQAQQKALSMLQQLEMSEYAHKYPQALSGGQQQRVALARALCLNPRILLLDEPTASLDPANTTILVKILKKLATQGFIIALSSQDMSFVRMVFDRVYYIQEGSIAEFCDDSKNVDQCPNIKAWVLEEK